jgi:hypothetical protein
MKTVPVILSITLFSTIVINLFFATPNLAQRRMPASLKLFKQNQEHSQDNPIAKRKRECLKWPGVSVYQTQNPQIYFAEYLPDGIKNKPPSSIPILVCLHGSHGTASSSMYFWYSYAKERGCALICLQWWLGGETYLFPRQVYQLIDQRMHQLHAQEPALCLKGNMTEGFSRGGTYMPALALIDKQTGKDMFSMFLINSGTWPAQNTPRFMLDLMKMDPSYEGKHFCAYYGDKDEHLNLPAKDGKIMRDTIIANGGKFDLFFNLPDGKHASFVHDKKMVNKVLDAWYASRKIQPQPE